MDKGIIEILNGRETISNTRTYTKKPNQTTNERSVDGECHCGGDIDNERIVITELVFISIVSKSTHDTL